MRGGVTPSLQVVKRPLSPGKFSRVLQFGASQESQHLSAARGTPQRLVNLAAGVVTIAAAWHVVARPLIPRLGLTVGWHE